jgi:hypothetical protein
MKNELPGRKAFCLTDLACASAEPLPIGKAFQAVHNIGQAKADRVISNNFLKLML